MGGLVKNKIEKYIKEIKEVLGDLKSIIVDVIKKIRIKLFLKEKEKNMYIVVSGQEQNKRISKFTLNKKEIMERVIFKISVPYFVINTENLSMSQYKKIEQKLNDCNVEDILNEEAEYTIKKKKSPENQDIIDIIQIVG